MIMHDQSRRLSEPLRWGRREKTIVAVLLTCVILGGGGLVAYALTSGSPARSDCIHLTFASTLGGARIDACGQRARKICASPGGLRGLEDDLRVACRRAGFAFGHR